MSDVLASVLRQELDWSLLPARDVAAPRRLLARCWNAIRACGWRDIGEARVEIRQGAVGSRR
jgi:hypothetical protein